jgi:DNA-binding XRE family transcriptional regulator
VEKATNMVSKQFAANLRRHREAVKLSQEELAGHCGLHRTEISLLECCQTLAAAGDNCDPRPGL